MQHQKTLSDPRAGHSVAPASLLVADDDPQLRELYQMVMERAGHRVRLARDGRECLDLYRRSLEEHNPYDLVLLDLYMPVMDGRQCLEGIFALDPQAKVLLATGLPRNELGPWAEKMTGVISKPMSMATLLDYINRCLGRALVV